MVSANDVVEIPGQNQNEMM